MEGVTSPCFSGLQYPYVVCNTGSEGLKQEHHDTLEANNKQKNAGMQSRVQDFIIASV